MALAHYRIYELDSADHILADYSVICRSDAAAMVAARRAGGAAVAVWEGTRRVDHRSAEASYPPPLRLPPRISALRSVMTGAPAR